MSTFKYASGAALVAAVIIGTGLLIHVPFVVIGFFVAFVLLGYYVLVPRN